MKKKWHADRAKNYMNELANDFIEGLLFAEGGELLYEVRHGDGCNSEKNFRSVIKNVCWWDADLIDQAVVEAQQLSTGSK